MKLQEIIQLVGQGPKYYELYIVKEIEAVDWFYCSDFPECTSA